MTPRKTQTSKRPTKVTRSIELETQRELWGRAAGRCEFSGCNRILFKSPVTQEKVNIGQMAHIYSFAAAGPRGRGKFATATAGLNDAGNLMLVCYDCHKKIDKDKKGARYSAELLKAWKVAHESRIMRVTGISADKTSHVVLYGARVGDERSPLSYERAVEAMFSTWYPAEDHLINLSMASALDDSQPDFWTVEAAHLVKEFDRNVRSRSQEAAPNHFSVFALAPQPLLMLLGSLFIDQVPAVIYQPHREPPSWQWQPHPENFAFKINPPSDFTGAPALVISLSDKVAHDRVTTVIPGKLSIWELTVENCHNDIIRSEAQLVMFREAARKLMVSINEAHPGAKSLSIFPAMPASCAVNLGRIRMPKANLPWTIYDQNNKHRRFIPAITIPTTNE